MTTEQQHAEEAGLEEEGGDDLVTQHRSDEVRGELGEVAPIGAELECHDDSRHHTHGEDDGEDLGPE